MAAKSMDDIAEILKKLKFRKKIAGGVDEEDVWRQLDLIQKEYQSAYDAQETYYQALLDERNAMIAKLKRRSSAAGNAGGTNE